MNLMDFENARFNMIEQQIRPAEVLEPAVLNAIARTPREEFVPPTYRQLAFVDSHIPLGRDQVMMTPIQEGRMLQTLQIKPTDKILEIGTGSGYLTALLAHLGTHVYSVDIHQEFVGAAQNKLTKAGIANITLDIGDASNGWDAHGPYDVIAVTGSLPLLPEAMKHSLTLGGRLCAIIGDAPVMECTLVTRRGNGEWHSEAVFETELPSLLNAAQPQRFVF